MRVYSLPGEQELLLHVAESDLGKMVGAGEGSRRDGGVFIACCV